MTKRRIFVAAVGALLVFFLTAFGSYFVEVHTGDGRLAMYVMAHSQQMNDQQLALAIGQDPFSVLRRAAMMTEAVVPLVAMVVGILVGCFEQEIPGKLLAVVLAPYFLWEFSISTFSVIRTPAQATLKIAKVLGADALWFTLAILAAMATARLITHFRSQHFQVRA